MTITCIAFLALSIVFCLPIIEDTKEKAQGMNSTDLILQVFEEEGSILREVYVDTTGSVTFAVDKHYASVVKKLDEKGHVVSEFYFGANNEPVSMYNGQFGVLRKYDEKGHEIKVTYVDEEGYPKWILPGYVGRAKEYNEDGQCIRIINLDFQGNPVNSSDGIAVEERALDEEGHLQKVMYFDVHGAPATNALGQFGEAYAYDEQGRKYKTTYLDSEGNPAPNTDGYTVLQKTYKADNTTDAELYFDANEQPVKLSHGEYGVRRENGRRYYLTKTGKVNYLLSLDELLHTNTLLSILVGCVLCVCAAFLPKTLQGVFLLLYVVFIIYMTLLYRAGGDPEGQFELFWSYKEFFSDRSMRIELFQNIWLFVPLGALLYYSIQKRWVLLMPLLFSIAIEAIQYFTGRGLFEFDDMISNGLGGCYGFWFGKLASEIRNRVRSHEKSKSLPI